MTTTETKKTFWDMQLTPQFQQIVTTLETAKRKQDTAMIIGHTRCGKTYSIDRFCAKHNQYTYRLTVSNLYRHVDLINELSDLVGIDYAAINSQRIQQYSLKVRVDKIVDKLKEIRRSGGEPIITFDEGENLEMSALKTVKALYDALKDTCSIVMIGTEQLLNKLLNLRKRQRDSIPQLYSRFKPGLKVISPVNKAKDFALFFKKYSIDKEFQKLLCELCDNYGELNAYLEPAMREASDLGVEFNEDFFRIKYDRPK